MIGLGTIINVAAILVGAGIGGLVGHRLPVRTRDVTTEGIGMFTLLIAGLSAVAVLDDALSRAVGDNAPVLIVLGAILVGGVCGSLVGINRRLEGLGAIIERRTARFANNGARQQEDTAQEDTAQKDTAQQKPEKGKGRKGGDEPAPRFVDAFVTGSLVMAVGPLAILGALHDGLGRGMDLLATKSVLDFFASLAFAASLGWGVTAAALSVLGVQGALTLIGFTLGAVLPDAHIAALTATGGILLGGVALRLLKLRDFPTGDLLPALVVAPLLTQLIIMVR